MPRILMLALLTLAMVARPCAAQTGPRVVKLTVQPALAPVPAMRYALLPEVRDLQPGNAALVYMRAYSPEWFPNLTRYGDFAHFQEWLDLPLAKAPLERAYNGVVINMLREVDRAARMESCDWQMLPRMRQEGFSMLIPDMQGFRTLTVLLALRSRLEMREGRLDKTVYSVQSGLAMSKHVGESPTLITYLIGVACASQTLRNVELLIEQPGAPNLYWALTDLPRPLIDLRRPLQGERLLVDATFPEVRAALRDRSEPPVPLHKLQRLSTLGIATDPLSGAIETAMTYPRARQYLLDHGWTHDSIAAMTVTQVVLMYGIAQYDVWADEAYTVGSLPYWEARPRLHTLQQRWDALRKEQPRDVPFVGVLFFNPDRIYQAKAQLQRWIDMLRCVEALRLYAAGNQGTLPKTLGDIRDVPSPIDAVTGKAFTYTHDGDRAVLEAPPPEGEPAGQHNALRIEIALKKS